MIAFVIYLNELQWKLIYLFISFTLTFIIIYYFIDVFLLLEIYPFVKFVHKTLIATHITELLNSVIYICTYVSAVFVFPLLSFYIQTFFSTSLYCYQLNFLKVSSFLILFVWVIIFTICYKLLLPQFFEFFTQWEVKECNYFFILELNAKIQFYLIWINSMYNFLSFLSLLLLSAIFFSFSFLSSFELFNIFKRHRKHLNFCFIFFSYLITPPEFILQISVLFVSFFVNDLLFFILCFKIQQEHFLIAQ